MAEIEGLVRRLREGNDKAKTEAAQMLGDLAWFGDNRATIVEAGGIPPLVDVLRDGSMGAKEEAVSALFVLAYNHDDNKVLIADAGGIPLLVELVRDGRTGSNPAAGALQDIARNNDANAVAIAATVGLEALVQLARRGNATVDGHWVVWNAALPAKRKAALVVAALLRDCVPVEARSQVRDLVRGVIGPYL